MNRVIQIMWAISAAGIVAVILLLTGCATNHAGQTYARRLLLKGD